MEIRYLAVLDPQPEGGYVVEFSDVPGAVTEGATVEEALTNAAEALSGVLESAIEHGHEIRVPGLGKASHLAHFVAPNARVQAALLVHFTRGDRTMAELARATETSWSAAKRLEDAQHWPSLKTLDRVATAMGKRLVLRME